MIKVTRRCLRALDMWREPWFLSRVSSTETFSSGPKKSQCASTHRQHSCGFLYQPPGRSALAPLIQAGAPDPCVVPGKLFCTLVWGTSLRSPPRYHGLLYSRLSVLLASRSPTRKSLIVCVQCEHWTHTSTELPCGERQTNCWYATVLLKRVFQLLSRPLVGG